jgi:Fe-Mn family superoxide dismutase
MFERVELSYGLSALEPFIDTRTMNEHYNVHYKKYTDNLNEAIAEENLEGQSIHYILLNYRISKKLRDNAGGFYNHFLYFQNISPYHRQYELYSSAELKALVSSRFRSYENFKERFKDVGLKVFGSGWVWLILKNGVLEIVTTANQDNPLMTMDCEVLLGMDVWEHAYYLKHLADRKSYIDDFFEVIDWKIISERI